MSKTIKRIISSLLVVAAFATVEPVNYINLITEKAYASSSSFSSNDDALLESLDTDEGSLSFSSKRSTATGKVKSSVDEVEIKAEADDSSYEVTIDGHTNTGECEKTVDLNKGRNTFKIKVEDPSGDKTSVTYYVYITRGSALSSSDDDQDDNDNDNDDVYLDNLTISGYELSFLKTKNSYDIEVAESIDKIKIKAEPNDEDDDKVTIDKILVDENDDFKKWVKLDKGQNIIEVTVRNEDYEERTYTLSVKRGTAAAGATNTISASGANTANAANAANTASAANTSSTATNTNSNINSTVKSNQWVKNAYNQWTYNDYSGKPKVNTWFYDVNYGKWYKLGYDGVMCIGWQFDNGEIYYLNEDGSMQTGGRYIGGTWYNFDKSGAMI